MSRAQRFPCRQNNMNTTTESAQNAPKTALQEIANDIDSDPVFVVDKRDSLNCFVVRFCPKSNHLLVWKNLKSEEWGNNDRHEECLGLHIRDVDGGEEELKRAGIWDKMSPEAQKEIAQVKVEALQSRIEAIKRGHETRKKRKEQTADQIKAEKVKMELKKLMDEKFPNRGKGRGTVEMRAYREEMTKRVTEAIEKEAKETK